MRWTIRGIEPGKADAVRDLAYETGSTLGEVLMLCIQHGLPKARRHLNAASADKRGIAPRYQNAPPKTLDAIFDRLRRYTKGDRGPT